MLSIPYILAFLLTNLQGTYIHSHTRTHTHTYTHTPTHTHMHACIHSYLHTDIPADLQTYRVETTETWDILGYGCKIVAPNIRQWMTLKSNAANQKHVVFFVLSFPMFIPSRSRLVAQPSRATSATRRVESGFVWKWDMHIYPYVMATSKGEKRWILSECGCGFFVDLFVPIFSTTAENVAIKTASRWLPDGLEFRGVAVLPSSYLKT